MRRFRWLSAGATALVLVLSACAPGGGSTPTVAPTAAPAAKPTTPPAAPAAASPVASPAAAASPAASPAAAAKPAASPAAAASPSPAAKPAASPSAAPAAGGPKPTVRMGSTNFAEQVTLAEVYGQILEASGYRVERRLNLGNREITFPALDSNQIDMYIEYMATLVAYLNKDANITTDERQVLGLLQDALRPKNITALNYAPAVDENGFVVTKATADKYKLTKTSDLAPVAKDLVLGGPPECPTRPFCLLGLQNTYGLQFKEFKPLDTGGPLTVAALQGNQIDVALLFTSDAVIAAQGLVLLEDDKKLQRPDNVIPIVRNSVLDQGGAEMRDLLNSVSAKLTTAELTSMNKDVGIDRKDSKDVANAWLKKQGLIR